MAFVLTQENASLQRFYLKSTERFYASLKNGNRNFQNSPPFKRSACFYVTTTGDFERFQFLSSKIIFLKN